MSPPDTAALPLLYAWQSYTIREMREKKPANEFLKVCQCAYFFVIRHKMVYRLISFRGRAGGKILVSHWEESKRVDFTWKVMTLVFRIYPGNAVFILQDVCSANTFLLTLTNTGSGRVRKALRTTTLPTSANLLFQNLLCSL